MEDLIEAIQGLVHAPVTFRNSLRFGGVRERVISGCTIYYQVTPDTGENATAGNVLVLHVKLPGQDDPTSL